MTTAADPDRQIARLHAVLPAPRSREGAFSVEPFLMVLTSARDVLANASRDPLERLRRKVEVARHLYAYYDAASWKPCTVELADPGYVSLLCAFYLTWADRNGDLVALNAALKMMDGILLAPIIPKDPSLDDWAEYLLERIHITNA
jgi:hypothetical protein